METFSAIIVGVRGANNENFDQVIVADGNGEKNHDDDGFSRIFHDEYTIINDVFQVGENVLVMFKKRYHYIQIQSISEDRCIHHCYFND